MTWISLALLGALVVAVTRIFFAGAGRRIEGLEFEHWIHSLMKVKKDGGTMTFSHVESPVFLRLRRENGAEARCHLLIDVPRAGWSESYFDGLRRRVESIGLSFTVPVDEIGVLLRVTLEIPDLWDPASGAAGARLAQELFKVLGLQQGARFNVSMKGENSLRTWRPTVQRWQQGDRPLLRGVGQRIEDEAKKEAEAEQSDNV